MTNEVLTASVRVPRGPADAFDLFARRFGDWWPPEFSWSGEHLLGGIGIEPRADGALYEIGPHGLRWDWGRVLDWRPAELLAFSWQIGPDRVPVPDADSASEVIVGFDETETASTTVAVEHGGWERHGPEGAAYRDSFTQVWPYVLGRLADLAG